MTTPTVRPDRAPPTAHGAQVLRREPSEEIERIRRLLTTWRRLPDDLVHLEPVPADELDSAARELVSAFELHRNRLDLWLATSMDAHQASRRRAERLLADHQRFGESILELQTLREIVRQDGHGGNRQALGQYWRLVWEALARHLTEEEDLLDSGFGRP